MSPGRSACGTKNRAVPTFPATCQVRGPCAVSFAVTQQAAARPAFRHYTSLGCLAHRSLAPFRAISERLSADSFIARALPPFRPPFRPIRARYSLTACSAMRPATAAANSLAFLGNGMFEPLKHLVGHNRSGSGAKVILICSFREMPGRTCKKFAYLPLAGWPFPLPRPFDGSTRARAWPV
jgi:hypothetical protein